MGNKFCIYSQKLIKLLTKAFIFRNIPQDDALETGNIHIDFELQLDVNLINGKEKGDISPDKKTVELSTKASSESQEFFQLDKIKKQTSQESNDQSPTAQKFNTIANQEDDIKQLFDKQEFIGDIKEAPQWLIDNKFILRGYRINHCSHQSIFKSLFKWHNDTINIWSHLIGALWIVGLLIYEIYFSEVENQEVKLTKAPIYILLVSQFGMFVCSTYLHTYFCHSSKLNQCVLKADYCGIAQLGLGKGFSIIYYALYCQEEYNWAYLGSWTVIWTLVFFLCLTNKFHQRKYKKYKIAIFFVCGAFMLAPVIHILYLGQQGHYSPWKPLFYTVSWIVVLFIGVLVTFTFQFPEKYFANKFDYVGASHQIWHVCVIIDTYLNYLGTYENYNLRSQQLEC